MKTCVKCGKAIPEVYKVCNYCNSPQPTVESVKMRKLSANPIATIFKVFAIIIFVAAFVAGLVLWINGLDFLFVLIYWASGFVGGMFMLAIAEIINLLNEICYKDSK